MSQGPTAGPALHKFLVDSPTEAAAVIRERLGTEARVISVREVARDGVGRFFKSPRLEVTAELPARPETMVYPEPPPAQPAPVYAPAPGYTPAPAVAAAYAQAPAPAPAPVQLPAQPPPRARVMAEPPQEETARLWTILVKAGLRRSLLDQLRENPEWEALAALPLPSALPRAAALLVRSVPVPSLPLGARCAFFGTPGAGVSTAVCKQLAVDPLVREGKVVVMKLEGARANAAEPLSSVCELLKVPLVRGAEELAPHPWTLRVYYDSPGLSLGHAHAVGFRKVLEEHAVESRVLVLNAAYETSLLQEYYARGEAAGATHVVFTHLDELPQWGKLWDFLLRGRLAPLFGSVGGSLVGESERELLAALVRRTVMAG
jgi:flagellar biosynthesis protein FlhF